MLAIARTAAEGLLRPFGYCLAPIEREHAIAPEQFDAEHRRIIDLVRPYTMTSPERIAATCQAVDYVVKYDVPGDFVECGVWRGGNTMAAALSYLRHGSRLPDLYLFDTFEGMSEPTDVDRAAGSHESAAALLARAEKGSELWARASLEDVRRNLATIDYPSAQIHFVKGMVEKTIPSGAPARVAVLRLDTDWYESTRHELEHLFPRLSPGGVLIIDDYGHWEGARRAVDEYFITQRAPILLARIDYTGRIGVRIA